MINVIYEELSWSLESVFDKSCATVPKRMKSRFLAFEKKLKFYRDLSIIITVSKSYLKNKLAFTSVRTPFIYIDFY